MPAREPGPGVPARSPLVVRGWMDDSEFYDIGTGHADAKVYPSQQSCDEDANPRDMDGKVVWPFDEFAVFPVALVRLDANGEPPAELVNDVWRSLPFAIRGQLSHDELREVLRVALAADRGEDRPA